MSKLSLRCKPSHFSSGFFPWPQVLFLPQQQALRLLQEIAAASKRHQTFLLRPTFQQLLLFRSVRQEEGDPTPWALLGDAER